MGQSLRPTEIRKRRHRKEKRRKLRQRLAHAPAAERSGLEGKLLGTYPAGAKPTPADAPAGGRRTG